MHFDQLDFQAPEKKSWSSNQVKNKIAGYTFVRNAPNRFNEVIYFDNENVAYRWISGQSAIARATWVISSRSVVPGTPEQTFVCVSFPSFTAAGEIIPGSAVPRCIDPSLFFIPATEHAQGDIFALSRRAAAPFALTAERFHIVELKAKVAAAGQTD